MLLLAFLAAAISWTRAEDVPTCDGPVQFTVPADSSQLTWYPTNFSGSQPPLFPNEYNCKYKIVVPPGWSAAVILTVNMTVPIDEAVSVRVIDSLRNFEAVYSTSNEHFFFVADGGEIQLNTREADVRFGFNVRWYRFLTFDPYHSNVTVAASQPTVFWPPGNSPIQIMAETRVSLVVTPPNDDNTLQFLRSVLIFDGPNWNATCLGTALQLLYRKKQFVSTGKYMTVQQLAPYWSLDRTMLIFQDYENTKDVVQFQGSACPFPVYCGQFSMDASQGTAAVVTILDDQTIGAEYITEMFGSGVLDVYIGGKTSSKSNLITSYQVNNSSSRLPQEFLGYVRTYVLTGGMASVTTTRSGQEFQKNAAGRRTGFVASRYYKSGKASPFQKTYDFFNKGAYGAKNHYVFTIQEADFVGNTTLEVSVSNDEKQVYKQTFNSSNPPSLKNRVQAFGSDFTVSYQTYGYSTKGFYLDYEFGNSSFRYGFFGSLFVLLSFVLIQ